MNFKGILAQLPSLQASRSKASFSEAVSSADNAQQLCSLFGQAEIHFWNYLAHDGDQSDPTSAAVLRARAAVDSEITLHAQGGDVVRLSRRGQIEAKQTAYYEALIRWCDTKGIAGQ